MDNVGLAIRTSPQNKRSMNGFAPMICVEGLACERGGVPIFAGVSFTIPSGHCGVLRGDNGAGKSTLLRVVSGLLSPTHGRVVVQPREAGERHAIFPDAGIKPDVNVGEQLSFDAAIMGIDARQSVLEHVGLAHALELPGRALSTGQRRRFALARLLVDERPLWLLDEPTAGLDGTGRSMFRRMLADHLEAGGIALVATHDEDLALPANIIELELTRS